jgi:hypothetical protein
MTEQPAKYGNRKITVDGLTFDSRAEARRYGELKLLQAAGEIRDLEMHPRFDLVPGVVLDGRKRPPIRYTADFAYWENGERVVEDVKSPASKTTAYKMRRHLMKHERGIEIREVS